NHPLTTSITRIHKQKSQSLDVVTGSASVSSKTLEIRVLQPLVQTLHRLHQSIGLTGHPRPEQGQIPRLPSRVLALVGALVIGSLGPPEPENEVLLPVGLGHHRLTPVISRPLLALDQEEGNPENVLLPLPQSHSIPVLHDIAELVPLPLRLPRGLLQNRDLPRPGVDLVLQLTALDIDVPQELERLSVALTDIVVGLGTDHRDRIPILTPPVRLHPGERQGGLPLAVGVHLELARLHKSLPAVLLQSPLGPSLILGIVEIPIHLSHRSSSPLPAPVPGHPSCARSTPFPRPRGRRGPEPP